MTTIRAATPAESLPPLVDASPEAAVAILRYRSAAALARQGATWCLDRQRAVAERDAAWAALEALLLSLPRAWHVVDGVAWGLAKVGKGGFEVVRRDPRTIRQP
jgi:hypothetical protein